MIHREARRFSMTPHLLIVATKKVVGEEITILANGAQTGSCEFFRQAGPQGSGPPPHHHPWDEAFDVISGKVNFGIEGE
jgi:quercetin dioxygenase-like cupin family protein